MNDNEEHQPHTADNDKGFLEGRDFYYEDGLMVLTRYYLLARGYCCEKGCRHCPYREPENPESK